jgi:hypothetical protein
MEEHQGGVPKKTGRFERHLDFFISHKWPAKERVSKVERFLVRMSVFSIHIALFAALILSILTACDEAVLIGPPRVENLFEVKSDDGLYSVVVYQKHTGAGDPFYTYAELHYKERSQLVEVLFVMKGDAELKVKWDTHRAITIEHPDLEIVRQVTVVSGKTVKYHEID